MGGGGHVRELTFLRVGYGSWVCVESTTTQDNHHDNASAPPAHARPGLSASLCERKCGAPVRRQGVGVVASFFLTLAPSSAVLALSLGSLPPCRVAVCVHACSVPGVIIRQPPANATNVSRTVYGDGMHGLFVWSAAAGSGSLGSRYPGIGGVAVVVVWANVGV